MSHLLDTNALIWAGWGLMDETIGEIIAESDIYFSTVSLWEIVIKNGKHPHDFHLNTADFRREMLNSGFRELDIQIEHILAVGNLPSVHKDPFDRLLIAQANVDHLTLLTSDTTLAKYPGDIQLIPTPKPDFDKEWAE